MSKLESENKSAQELREISRAKRRKMDEENEKISLALKSELDALEKAKNDAKVNDAKTRTDKVSANMDLSFLISYCFV